MFEFIFAAIDLNAEKPESKVRLLVSQVAILAHNSAVNAGELNRERLDPLPIAPNRFNRQQVAQVAKLYLREMKRQNKMDALPHLKAAVEALM